jgi:hypothetical protein
LAVAFPLQFAQLEAPALGAIWPVEQGAHALAPPGLAEPALHAVQVRSCVASPPEAP